MHFERRKINNFMHFERHYFIFYRKNKKKKICLPTLPKIFRPVTRSTLIFYLTK